MPTQPTCTAFQGSRRIASGDPPYVAMEVKAALERDENNPVLVFDDKTGRLVEFDVQGTAEGRGTPASAAHADKSGPQVRGPGRPRLGVIAREVTLLPRHWDWLNEQPGGASVALRKLVDAARIANEDKDKVRLAKEAADRFMSALAGNEPGYEDASRALYAGDKSRFEAFTASWPVDVRDHARRLACAAFDARAG